MCVGLRKNDQMNESAAAAAVECTSSPGTEARGYGGFDISSPNSSISEETQLDRNTWVCANMG